MSNTNFPTSIDSPTDPSSSNTLNSPSHSAQHGFENDAIVALETKVGVDGSAVTTTLDYKLSGVTGTDKAASKTGTETLTNKTLGSGTVISLGSDATGDIYYRNSGGVTTRLPIGSTGQILDVSSGGIPEWIPNPSAANASTTVKGVVEMATAAEINAGTATGGTGAALAVSPDQLLLSNYANAVKFGGTGADGALSITSGTTTLSAGTAASLIKNYTSISITGTGVLGFSNPHTNGTFIVLKSQGDVTLTSSATPMIDLSGIGAAGGAGGSGSSTSGSAGSQGNNTNNSLTVGSASSAASGVYIGGMGVYTAPSGLQFTRSIKLVCGSGGGGGTSGAGGSSGAGGNGGRGGGALYIECGGAWNFTTASGISINGANGSNGASTSGSNGGGGGGGGGSAGMLVVLYTSLTANSGTITASGGSGGTGGTNSSDGGQQGGAGGSGAGAYNAGGASSAGATSGNASNGSNGGAGAGGGGVGGTGHNSNSGTGGTSSSDSNLIYIAANTNFN